MSITTDQSDFDAPPDRVDAHSMKWGLFPRDVLPYWVMDMDFAVPKFLQEALASTVGRGFLGYAQPSVDMNHTFAAWLERNHGWAIDPDWVAWVPDVVVGLRHALQVTVAAGESVMMHQPIYHPFRSVPRHVEGIHVDLARESESWTIDFDAMAAAVKPDTRLLYLCNPQNPTCRVYSEEELHSLLDFCERHGLVLCSDEVHSLFVLDESLRHSCVGALGNARGFEQTISLFSPSKTYNISGCSIAAAVIPDAGLRERFKGRRGPYSSMGRLDIEATKRAYEDTTDYVPALLNYLRGNEQLVRDRLGGVDGLAVTRNEGTYNAFVDLSAFEIESVTAHFEQHGIGILDCASFGAPTFTRINFATPRHLLEGGLDRLQAGVDALDLASFG